MKRALLLGAGLGTRLKPLTDYIPKCLMPIHGKPLLEYWLRSLIVDGGFEKVLINTHHLHQLVENYISVSDYQKYVKLVYEPELLGTGGTIKRNIEFFNGCEDVFVAHADNYSSFNMKRFVRAHDSRPSECVMTMVLFESETPQSCGIVELDKQNRVVAFHEKVANPPGRLANGAVYLMNKALIDQVARMPGEFIDLSTQVIPNLMGQIYAFDEVQFHVDIGTIPAWQSAQSLFSEGVS